MGHSTKPVAYFFKAGVVLFWQVPKIMSAADLFDLLAGLIEPHELALAAASVAAGNLISIDDQWRKLELVVDTARKVWS